MGRGELVELFHAAEESNVIMIIRKRVSVSVVVLRPEESSGGAWRLWCSIAIFLRVACFLCPVFIEPFY